MARENFYIRLQHENGQEYFLLNGKEKNYNTDDLIDALRMGIRNRTVKFGDKIVEKDHTKYIFNVESYSEEKSDFYNARFSIKVLEKDKKDIKTVTKLEALTNTQIKLRNKNKTRLSAGILIGIILLSMSSPAIAKGLNKLFKREYEYNQVKYTQHADMIEKETQFTFEDRIEAQKDYYKDLAERAKEGDQAAIDELTRYNWEQQQLEEIKEEERTNGYVR